MTEHLFGDRVGRVRDLPGHQTRVEDVDPVEMGHRAGEKRCVDAMRYVQESLQVIFPIARPPVRMSGCSVAFLPGSLSRSACSVTWWFRCTMRDLSHLELVTRSRPARIRVPCQSGANRRSFKTGE
jgi:hypothetical protein